MKNLVLMTIAMAMLVSCSDSRTTEAIVTGKDGVGTQGPAGASGSNGVDATVLKPGLLCSVYDAQSVDRNNGLITILANSVPKFTTVIKLFDVGDSQAVNGFPKFTAAQQALIGTEDYAMDCDGYINIPVSNNYKFRMLSDDNSRLVINNSIIINMDALQPPTWSSVNSVLLYKGLNKINILYFQGPHTQIALRLEFQSVTSSGYTAMQLVPSTILFNLGQ